MSQINNRRVLKNTLYLYIRMLFGLIVSLITARVILDALGVIDYGLNNVVGGMVTMFSFITNTLSTSSSRFMSYSIGQGETESLRKVFSNAHFIHFVIGIVVILLGETLGLYLINFILNIPPERIFACNVLWQTVLIGSFMSILTVPMSALVISHERMNVYAYIGLFDIVIRFVIVYLVKFSPFDKLITLAILNLFVPLVVISLYTIYCKRNFSKEMSFSLKRDKDILKQMLSFTGWNIIGSLSNMLRHTGLNMLLNVFFGPIANAANAIAFRVNNAIVTFTGSVTTAVNPQIIKAYAAGEHEGMKNMIFKYGKLTYYILLMLCLPVLFECNYILRLWLGDVFPPDAIILTRIVLIISMVETFTYSIGCAVQATGRVKDYQILTSGISLAIFPLSWALFYFGYPMYYGLIIYLICSIIALLARLYFVKTLLNISISEYCYKVFARTSIATIFTLPLPLIIYDIMPEGFIKCLIIILAVEIAAAIAIWGCGLEKEEKEFIRITILNFFKR